MKVNYILLDASLNGYEIQGGQMSLVVLVTIGIEGDVHGFSKQENTTIQIDGDKTINEVFIKSDSIIRDAAQNYINENYPPVK